MVLVTSPSLIYYIFNTGTLQGKNTCSESSFCGSSNRNAVTFRKKLSASIGSEAEELRSTSTNYESNFVFTVGILRDCLCLATAKICIFAEVCGFT
jgi:hypothetical protein